MPPETPKRPMSIHEQMLGQTGGNTHGASAIDSQPGEDRSKMPAGTWWQSGPEADALAAAWAFVDRIRQEERERLAALFDDGLPDDDAGRNLLAAHIATWLREGAKGEP